MTKNKTEVFMSSNWCKTKSKNGGDGGKKEPKKSKGGKVGGFPQFKGALKIKNKKKKGRRLWGGAMSTWARTADSKNRDQRQRKKRGPPLAEDTKALGDKNLNLLGESQTCLAMVKTKKIGDPSRKRTQRCLGHPRPTGLSRQGGESINSLALGWGGP